MTRQVVRGVKKGLAEQAELDRDIIGQRFLDHASEVHRQVWGRVNEMRRQVKAENIASDREVISDTISDTNTADIIITDTDRLDFIAECARYGRTGVVFTWDGHGFYRFAARRDFGLGAESLRDAIDVAITSLRPKRRNRA